MLSLYDLTVDTNETTNVADAHPEVIERMQALAATARVELGDSLTKTKGSLVRTPRAVK